MVKISVIMPVYNDEEYLSESIDSFLKQTLDDIELVCVNDGSTDSSLDILNDYANRYTNIKVYTKENEGSGIARNYALEKSEGEYIAYLDSDDVYVDAKALELMYEVALKHDADMVSANLKVLDLDGTFYINKILDQFDKASILSPEDYGVPYSFYKNIFKKSFLTENHLSFPDLLRGQDPVFLAEILTLIDDFPAVPIDLYGFRKSERSDLLKMNTYRKRYDYIKHFKDTFDILTDAGFHQMKKNYEGKLTHYLKASHNRYTKEVKDITYDVFKDDADIIELVNEYFFNPKVSVLIPVGNLEDCLEESLKTLRRQSLRHLEFIFINCNSTDNSMELLNDLTLTDSRIRILDEKTGDTATARRILLNHVTGDYVYFFNLGDKLKKHALKHAYKSAVDNNSNMVIFKAYDFDEDGPITHITYNDYDKILNREKYDAFSFRDVKEYVLGHEFYPWLKLYEKGFIKDLSFDGELGFSDVPFHVKSILKAEKISFVNRFLYHHWAGPENNVSNDIFEIIRTVEDILVSENHLDEFKDDFNRFKVNQILNNIDSQEYFTYAREEFKNIERSSIEDDDYLLTNYDLLLDSDSFQEFKPEFELKCLEHKFHNYNFKLNQLENENQLLKEKNKDLNKTHNDILSSTSWAVTKPLRKLKK